MSFEEQFFIFSRLGDTRSGGISITLSQSDKWMKQAGIINSKITTADTAVCFNKFKKKSLNLKEYQIFIDNLAKRKDVDPQFIIHKLISCGTPNLSNATQPIENETIRRLTDPSNATGCHKERYCLPIRRANKDN
ncbi:tubulin polymerization-promoting protein homolog [Chelonus insularis]|uniref:tubulin polymerization-promoting protein homolog n=1 Tax=Chelonus insularis TaxID=460826 RepID=UPI00158A560A|nr:tubulin polymerization-promoting protein homolog [Chelonus insularis]